MYRIIVLGSEVDLYTAIMSMEIYTIYRTHHIKGMTSQVYYINVIQHLWYDICHNDIIHLVRMCTSGIELSSPESLLITSRNGFLACILCLMNEEVL